MTWNLTASQGLVYSRMVSLQSFSSWLTSFFTHHEAFRSTSLKKPRRCFETELDIMFCLLPLAMIRTFFDLLTSSALLAIKLCSQFLGPEISSIFCKWSILTCSGCRFLSFLKCFAQVFHEESYGLFGSCWTPFTFRAFHEKPWRRTYQKMMEIYDSCWWDANTNACFAVIVMVGGTRGTFLKYWKCICLQGSMISVLMFPGPHQARGAHQEVFAAVTHHELYYIVWIGSIGITSYFWLRLNGILNFSWLDKQRELSQMNERIFICKW